MGVNPGPVGEDRAPQRWPLVDPAPGLPVLVLVLSYDVERLYASELLAGGVGGIGYLHKDQVTVGAQFLGAVRRVAAGGTAMDPEVIARLLTYNSGNGAVARQPSARASGRCSC